ncbi:MAG: Eco57I restriction-modification methylase domain-containing protein [Bernardetiaceae bacterium]|nr:Eco57I restriction-modification methylase domain-containing protein [Bernardetiaceae bacterium]
MKIFMEHDEDLEIFDWAEAFPQLLDADGNFEGFDVVMGNPPYLDSEYMVKNDPEQRKYIAEHFHIAQGNWDLFVPFIELSVGLLKEGGQFSYIIPNKLLSTDYAKHAREFLLSLCLHSVRDYSNKKVFPEADVYPVVISTTKNTAHSESYTTFETMEDINTVAYRNAVIQNKIRENEFGFYFLKSSELSILKKVLNHKKLEEFEVHISDASTVSEAYLLKEKIKNKKSSSKNFKKIINTGTIDPYTILWKIKKMRYIKDDYQTPIVTDTNLKKMSLKRFEQAASEKIIVAGMSKRIEAVYDNGEILAAKSTNIILHQDTSFLKFLLGLLNSKLISFYATTIFHSRKMAGGYINISPSVLRSIPIASYDESIVEVATEILAQKKNMQQADTSKLEQKIDRLVYKLYGLTKTEIAEIESFYGA